MRADRQEDALKAERKGRLPLPSIAEEVARPSRDAVDNWYEVIVNS